MEAALMQITDKSSKDAIITASQECLDYMEAKVQRLKDQRTLMVVGFLATALLYLLPG